MIRLLKWLITGDWHLCRWEDYDILKTFKKGHADTPICLDMICKCKTCGRYKTFPVGR